MIIIQSCNVRKYKELNGVEQWFFRNGGSNWMVIMPFVNFAGLFYICTNYHWYYYLVFLFVLLCFIGFLCENYNGLIYTEYKCECGGNMKCLGSIDEAVDLYRCSSCEKEVEG